MTDARVLAIVSVVIPTWNRAATLPVVIRSVLAQTVPPLEVLVCDDGSDDDSVDVVRALGDPRVRWLAGEHSGRPAVPRNRGIREAKGEWLAFLDSDDEWQPDKLKTQLERVGRSSCRAACSNAYRLLPGIGVDGTLLAWPSERIGFGDLLRNNYIITSSSLVHRSIVLECGGFPEDQNLRGVEDFALWLRVATRTDFVFVSEPLVTYTDDPKNSVRSYYISVSDQRVNVFRSFIDWAKSNRVGFRYILRARQRYLWSLYESRFKRGNSRT